MPGLNLVALGLFVVRVFRERVAGVANVVHIGVRLIVVGAIRAVVDVIRPLVTISIFSIVTSIA